MPLSDKETEAVNKVIEIAQKVKIALSGTDTAYQLEVLRVAVEESRKTTVRPRPEPDPQLR